MLSLIIAIFLCAAVFSCGLSFMFKSIALSFGIVNKGAENRHSKRTVPLLGGLAIFLSFWIIVFFLLYLNNSKIVSDTIFSVNADIETMRLVGVFIGATLILVVGLIDDVRRINPLIRIAVQAVSTLIMIHFGFKISFLYVSSFFSFCVTFLWVLLIINAFNLLDNMDGLSAGTGLIAALIFLTIAYLGESWFSALIISVFAGSIAGFLPWNLPRAKMFMGDAGSTFIGYLLAHASLFVQFHVHGENLQVAVLTPLLVFAVPIYDTVSVILIRLKRGQPIHVGDANHFSHRLVVLGMSERRALFANYLLGLAMGLTAILLLQVDKFGAYVILVAAFCIISFIALVEYSAMIKLRVQGFRK